MWTVELMFLFFAADTILTKLFIQPLHNLVLFFNLCFFAFMCMNVWPFICMHEHDMLIVVRVGRSDTLELEFHIAVTAMWVLKMGLRSSARTLNAVTV